MPAHKKPTPLRFCEECGKQLERKRLPNGDLEYLIHFNRRKFCDQVCMGRNFDRRHSPETGWSAAHSAARSLVAPGPCSRCGKPQATDVHHKDGNWRNNSPTNLERICRSCHSREHRQRGSCVICGKPHKGLGFCEMHYQRFKKWGDPLTVKHNQFTPARKDVEANPTRVCQVPGCTAKYHANGYCSRHAQQARRGTLGTAAPNKSEAAKKAWETRRTR
jgi:hypothetical protein